MVSAPSPAAVAPAGTLRLAPVFIHVGINGLSRDDAVRRTISFQIAN